MSVYSTKTITREDAIRQIDSELLRKKKLCTSDLSNEELEHKMFELFGDEYLDDSRFENYIVED